MAQITVGDRVKYLGPWDPCGSYDYHPYQGKIGQVVQVVSTPPLPERPFTVRFSDGIEEKAAQLELQPA